jgi:iron complex transport system substrate-binding protein
MSNITRIASTLSRRSFAALMGAVVAGAAVGAPRLSFASDETRTVTDMAGREVELPANPTKVMGAANPDGIIIYSIDPSLLTGWTFEPSDAAKAYLTPEAAELPQITSVSKWEEPNKEEILSMDPDFILVACDLDNTDFALYDDLTAEIDVPIVVIDADLPKLSDSYRFLATILPDQADQCEALADFIDQTFADVDATLEDVPEDERVRVLYSTGSEGIQTCGDSNWNGQFVTPAGGINVCDTDQTSGFSEVSMEQVLAWQPDVIISTASGDKAEIYGAEEWADVAAVEAGEVYAAPQLPFSWVDKPTGVNRVIGVKWTNSVLYPEQADYDIAEAVQEFYALFYHYELTDEEVADILDTKVEL